MGSSRLPGKVMEDIM
ncbi:MAG TPA: hypothetical protein DGM69_01890, partial [Chloroflexi bacterium]|nr:hypothetical protein [Chloroflexota bacterium]